MRLNKRRMTVEANICDTLLRLEADALASTLREKDDRVRRQRKHESELLAEAFNQEQSTSSSQQLDEFGAAYLLLEEQECLNVSSTQSRECEGSKQERSFGEATKQLKRTSNEMRGWKFDVSRALRLFANRSNL
jgi:hypothetical protein